MYLVESVVAVFINTDKSICSDYTCNNVESIAVIVHPQILSIITVLCVIMLILCQSHNLIMCGVDPGILTFSKDLLLPNAAWIFQLGKEH